MSFNPHIFSPPSSTFLCFSNCIWFFPPVVISAVSVQLHRALVRGPVPHVAWIPHQAALANCFSFWLSVHFWREGAQGWWPQLTANVTGPDAGNEATRCMLTNFVIPVFRVWKFLWEGLSLFPTLLVNASTFPPTISDHRDWIGWAQRQANWVRKHGSLHPHLWLGQFLGL